MPLFAKISRISPMTQKHLPKSNKPKTYDDNNRLISTGVFQTIERGFERLFGCLPGNLGTHNEPPVKRYLFPTLFVRKPGIWSLKTFSDALIFGWLNYRAESSFLAGEPEDEGLEMIKNFNSDQMKLSLVSALLTTVWASFCTTILKNYDDNPLNVAILFLFSTSTIGSFYSTILPIYLSRAASNIRNHRDVRHFLRLLQHSTFGLGSQSTIIILHLSAIASTIGICILPYVLTDYRTALYFSFSVAILFFIFVHIYLQIVSCLYCTMKSEDRVVVETQPTTLTFGELKKRLEGFLKFHDARTAEDLKRNCSADTFVRYIEVDSSETPLRLNSLTVKRARQLYTTFIEKNVFESFPVETLNLVTSTTD